MCGDENYILIFVPAIKITISQEGRLKKLINMYNNLQMMIKNDIYYNQFLFPHGGTVSKALLYIGCIYMHQQLNV